MPCFCLFLYLRHFRPYGQPFPLPGQSTPVPPPCPAYMTVRGPSCGDTRQQSRDRERPQAPEPVTENDLQLTVPPAGVRFCSEGQCRLLRGSPGNTAGCTETQKEKNKNKNKTGLTTPQVEPLKTEMTGGSSHLPLGPREACVSGPQLPTRGQCSPQRGVSPLIF